MMYIFGGSNLLSSQSILIQLEWIPAFVWFCCFCDEAVHDFTFCANDMIIRVCCCWAESIKCAVHLSLPRYAWKISCRLRPDGFKLTTFTRPKIDIRLDSKKNITNCNCLCQLCNSMWRTTRKLLNENQSNTYFTCTIHRQFDNWLYIWW